MGKIVFFEDLEVWLQARLFAKDIFLLTEKESFYREFRFKEQIKASSGSIMDNFAEGFERNGNKEFVQFLYIAKGSCGETRSQLQRAFDIELITEKEYLEFSDKAKNISQSLSNFIKYLKESEYKGIKYKSSQH